METTAMIYHIIQEGPGTGMIAACTSDPNGERNREPEERCNIPDAPTSQHYGKPTSPCATP